MGSLKVCTVSHFHFSDTCHISLSYNAAVQLLSTRRGGLCRLRGIYYSDLTGGEEKKNTSVNKRGKGWQWLEHPLLKSFWLLLWRDIPFAGEMRSNVGGHTVL